MLCFTLSPIPSKNLLFLAVSFLFFDDFFEPPDPNTFLRLTGALSLGALL